MARSTETHEIELAGRKYRFRQPKMAIMIAAMMQAKGKPEMEANQILLEMQIKWLRSGLGKEQWAEVETRMFDEDDELDWADVTEAFKMHSTKERPTTSASDSSDQWPTMTPSEENSKLPESIFGL